MLIQFSWLAISLLAMLSSFFFALALDDRRKNPWFFVCTGILSGFAALVIFFVIIATAISRPIGRTTCSAWSKQTNIPTKFVILNSWDTGTCLAKTPNGHWVINSNWGSFNN